MKANQYNIVVPDFGKRMPLRATAVLVGTTMFIEIVTTTLMPTLCAGNPRMLMMMSNIVHVIAGLCSLWLAYEWWRYYFGPQTQQETPLPPPPPPTGGGTTGTTGTTGYGGDGRGTSMPTQLGGISAQCYSSRGDSYALSASFDHLRRGGCCIGSAADCTMTVHDSGVHGHHAELRVHEGKLCVKALHQLELNGQLMAPGSMKKVRHGDTLRMGDARITFN